MYAVYALIVFIATTIGAIAGLGGGIIIKPLFDFLGYQDAATIGVLSAFAVFTMSFVSIIKQFRKGPIIKLDFVLLMSFGAFMGGLAGDALFLYTKSVVNNDALLKMIQAILLLVTLIVVISYKIFQDKIVTRKIENYSEVFFVGLGLGIISIFLGIGGGPLNIVFLGYLFSFEIKETVLYSITMVFFAQLSKLSQIYIKTHFLGYDLKLIGWICLFALMGGYLGSHINHKVSGVVIDKVYTWTMAVLVVITLVNIGIGIGIVLDL